MSHAFGPSSAKTPLVASDASSSYIVFEGVNATSIADASAWSAKEWRDNAADGFRLRGTHVKIINSRIENVRHAISIRAHNSEVSSNLISNFSGDGIRALGNDSIYKNNVISDCYKVDDNHDDGIQSWTIGPDGKVGTGQVRNVVISGNKIIATKNPNRKRACSLQGIGLFDGMFVNWRIENNLIETDDWHGITVMGAKNVRIVNNTLVDPLVGKPTAPWIAITAHKKGMPPRGSIIANNIAASYNQTGRKSFPATSSKQVLMRNNMSITNPNALFKDVVTLDFRPRERSAIINVGTSKFAPKLDINGTPRPTGSAVDIGTFQSR